MCSWHWIAMYSMAMVPPAPSTSSEMHLPIQSVSCPPGRLLQTEYHDSIWPLQFYYFLNSSHNDLFNCNICSVSFSWWHCRNPLCNLCTDFAWVVDWFSLKQWKYYWAPIMQIIRFLCWNCTAGCHCTLSPRWSRIWLKKNFYIKSKTFYRECSTPETISLVPSFRILNIFYRLGSVFVSRIHSLAIGLNIWVKEQRYSSFIMRQESRS